MDLGDCNKTTLFQNFSAHKSLKDLCISELVVGITEISGVFGETSKKFLTKHKITQSQLAWYILLKQYYGLYLILAVDVAVGAKCEYLIPIEISSTSDFSLL